MPWSLALRFARVIAIDRASHGRPELALAAAWYDEERHELGIPFPATGERFELLEDTLEIVARGFTGEQVSYGGKVWTGAPARSTPHIVRAGS